MAAGTAHEDGRDDDLHPPDPEDASKNNPQAASTTPPSLALVQLPLPLETVPSATSGAARASDLKKGIRVGAAKKQQAAAAGTRRLVKPSTAAATRDKSRRPPLSPMSTAAGTLKGRDQSLRRSLGLRKMSSTNGSEGGSQPQSPLSQGSHVQVEASPSPVSGSPQPESVSNSEPIPIEIEDDTDEIDEEEEGAVLAGSKRKLTSAIWKEFTKVEINGTVRAKCNYCSKKLSGLSRNGTNHLRLHLKSCVQKKIKLNGKTMAQSSLRFGRADAGTVTVENYTFDQDIARQELSAMIVLHEYPLSMVDHVGFRRFVGALQPLFRIGTRNTIRSDIMVQYEMEKNPGFIYVPAPHTADVIGGHLYESLVEWNLDEKLSAITHDNCTTNDAVIPYLLRNIGRHKLLNDGKLMHMRCSAHILNLIVKDGLDELKDAIENIRDSVAYWTATPKRIEKFEEIARFVKVDEKAAKKKIGLDCRTRWNSTFNMLSIALPYKSAFIRAHRVDRQYTCLPTKEEWKFAEDVVERLRLFNDITVLFSGKDYVTANIYFTQIAEVRKNIRQWSTCGNPLVEAMSANMVAKFDKYWTDIQGLMGIATLLDPRFKIGVLMVCFEDLLGTTSKECEDQVLEVKNSLADLMQEYHEEENVGNNEPAAPSIGNCHDYLSSLSARVASRRPASVGFKSELDRYLDEETLYMHTPDFEVLDWWKVAGTRFPTLRKIARDIFAIPVTTVASESAFSTSGRVLSEHGSRLTSKMLEALMCSQDWLRNKYKVDEKNKKAATFWSCLQDIQEGLQELAL